MDARTPKYAVVLLIFVIAAGTTWWVRSKPLAVDFSANMQALPMRLDVWQGHELRLSPEIRKALNADSILCREYVTGSSESPIELLVTYRRYGRRDFVHRPELCYPAAGWEITDKRYTTIVYGGRPIQTRQVVAEKGGEEEVILYWFVSGSRTEADYAKQQLKMALDRLRPQKYGWAFVRISCPVTSSRERTLADVRAFVRAASVSLPSILQGHGSHGARDEEPGQTDYARTPQ